jgi:hypothetical protein
MRTPALILAVAATILLTGHASPQDKVNPPKERAEDPVKKVHELQKERIATLQDVVTLGTKLAQNGRLELGEVMEDRMTLLKAELEVAEKESDRITLYTKAIDSLKEYEKLAKARVEAARGTELAVLKIKARRLELEIQLERAKSKLKDPK